VRRLCNLALIAATFLCACSGSGSFTPGSTAQATFQLSPSSIDLTPNAPADTFNGQGDVAGVTYTPVAQSACTTPTGSIVVAGNGQGQLDVSGSPLLFTVVAAGATPPSTCQINVTGSDGSFAFVTVNYSNTPVTNIPDSRTRVNVVARRAGSATPNAMSFTSLVSQVIAVSGFSGTIASNVSCTSSRNGITVSQSDATDFTVIPWGQGAISNTCSITLSDATTETATVNVALSIGAMARLNASPSTVQFGCAGATAPYNCRTLGQVALAESGTQTYSLVTRPTVRGTCINAFYGPLTMTADGTTFAQSVKGSAVAVTFAGLLNGAAPNCSQIVITDGNTPAQRVSISVNSALGAAPGGLAAATPPPCTGNDGHVADPAAPHGLYVWNPYQVKGGMYEADMEQYVIGKDQSGKPKDPNICGVSLLVEWSEVEKSKLVFDWSKVISQAMPYVNAGLTVNLLFVDASETAGASGTNTATPDWVFSTDGVAQINCNDSQPPYPNYMDPQYETDWEALIDAAVAEFSTSAAQGGSSITSQIGYMRFGIGAGTESYAAHMTGSSADAANCLAIWQAAPAYWTYDNWVTHTRHIVNHMGSVNAHSKQLLIAMNEIPFGASDTIYSYPNAEAEVAANNGVGFGTENLGIGHVVDAGSSKPVQPCNPPDNNGSIYWCEAFLRHVGVVPYEFQPIEAVADPDAGYNIDFSKLLQYGLMNNAQIFELYPQDWLEADGPAGLFSTGDQKTWKTALTNAALTVGAQP